MIITRKSPLTGIVNAMEIAVSARQLLDWSSGKGLIQDIMPDLTATEREFIMSGYTQEDWDKMFPPEEEE